ncbi:hypothetical protein ACFYOK_36025 [Microbispora bryophytorum]|uniref:hypothetical protein n=1 Tax=Microbispora bryophytorum TaxID=1460882 RepID=UPI0033DA20EA
MTTVRRDLGLTRGEEQRAAQRLRREYPWLAILVLDPEDDDDWRLCPRVSPHPSIPVGQPVELLWCADSPGDGRVIEYTCTCGMTNYELLSYGGIYRIRRVTVPRDDVPPVSYTGGWRRPEAYEWWRRVLSGQAR